MREEDIAMLERFIVSAKQATYVGEGKKLLSYRPGSIDLQYTDGEWAYHDSYFGGSNFIGQEIVYQRMQPVWGMNYFGYILKPQRATAAQMGAMIKQSLTRMYAEGRFLGGFEYTAEDLRYNDASEGEVSCFRGIEQIYRDDELVYELIYHGGLILS